MTASKGNAASAKSAAKSTKARRSDAAPAPPPAPDDDVDVDFLQRVAGTLRALRNYTRLRVDGLDHVPEQGPAIIAGNHTGWLGLDYALTALSVYDAGGRLPRGMAHEAWFRVPAAARFAKKVGLYQITKDAMKHELEKGHLVMMFPEGEKGAFRPGSDYTLEPFARGFVRVAMETGAPVIPVAILGGEESNPVGRRIESYEDLVGLKGGLPLPKNILPRPVKWRIRFLPPVDLDAYGPEDAADRDLVYAIAEATRARVQRELRKMQVERGNPYF